MLFSSFFKKNSSKVKQAPKGNQKIQKDNKGIAERKGVLGEYKIDIQLSQLPKDYKYLNDLLLVNSKAKSGFSQIDHVVISPYGIFVIETKNYQGIIYGERDSKTWLVNGKFKMMNPFIQNYGHIEALKKFVDKHHHELFISIVSFTKRCTFKVGTEYRKIGSNELLVYDVELSEYINRKIAVIKLLNKQPLLSLQDIFKIYKDLFKANITDPNIRKKHIEVLKTEKNDYSQ